MWWGGAGAKCVCALPRPGYPPETRKSGDARSAPATTGLLTCLLPNAPNSNSKMMMVSIIVPLSRAPAKNCQDASPTCLAQFSSDFWMRPNATAELAELLAGPSRDAVLSARDRSKHSALNMAAFRGHLDGVLALIAAGADVHNPDLNLHRPLHHSVLGPTPHAEIVRALLAAGATLQTAKDGKTPLQIAQAKKLTEILPIMRAAEARPTGTTSQRARGSSNAHTGKPRGRWLSSVQTAAIATAAHPAAAITAAAIVAATRPATSHAKVRSNSIASPGGIPRGILD